ncbi:hypothetical protein LSCM1_02567 [Leishmania martiniquensis]|uniref:FCP1 homology domain-containing protein n=1 Tax=Leishmania martiniquensis TaxID=1580590 RepID=A0A836GKH2_9TRYP|nr:hypothetical protein LSCM1_02567 [Leishmania martiniquensis]
MPKGSDSRQTSENSESADALRSNEPRRLSAVTKRSCPADLPFHSDTSAVLSNPTSTATGSSRPRSKGGRDDDSSCTKLRCVVRKRLGSAEASARGVTLQAAHARQASSMGVAEASVTSPRHSLAGTGEASYARTSTTTSSLTAEILSPIHVRLGSVALATTAAHSFPQQVPFLRIPTPASRMARKLEPSTVGHHSDLPVPPPETSAAEATRTPCLMPAASSTNSEHRTDVELALLSAELPLSGTDPKEEQSLRGEEKNGAVEVGRHQAPNPAQRADKSPGAPVSEGSGAKGADETSEARTEAPLSPPFLLDVDPVPSLAQRRCLTDPAPHINGRKQRSSITQNLCTVTFEIADDEPSRELPSPAILRSSSHSLAERLVRATSATHKPRSLSVLCHAPSQLMGTPSSAPQTPQRNGIVTEARDCDLSTLECSRSNEGSLTASSSAEAASTALGASLPVTSSSSQANGLVSRSTPVHMAQPASAFLPQSSASAPTPPHTPGPSAETHCLASATATLCLGAVNGRAEVLPSILQQRRRASCSAPRRDLLVDHFPSSGSRSPSAVEAVHSPAPAQAPSLVSISSEASAKTTATAPAPRRSSSAPSSPHTPAASSSASVVSVHDNMGAEISVGRSTPMLTPPRTMPELRTVESLAAWADSEGSLSSSRSGSCFTPRESFAVLPEDLPALRQRTEEDVGRTCTLPDDDHTSNRALKRDEARISSEAVSEPEGEERSAVMYSADASGLHHEGTEDDEVMKSSAGEPYRGTVANGHAHITPCLHSTEQEQQRHSETLCTLANKDSAVITAFLQSPEALMRGGERTGVERDGSAVDGVSDAACDAADRKATQLVTKSSRKRPPIVAALPQASKTALVARASRARPEGGPPARDTGRVSASTTQRSDTSESTGSQCRASVSAASPPGAKAREASQPVSLTSGQTNGSSIRISSPPGRAAGEEGPVAKFTRALTCNALSGAVAFRATTVSNTLFPAAGGSGAHSSSREPRRRSSLPIITTSGGPERAPRTAYRRGDGTSGLLNGAGTLPPHNMAATASENLLPPLFSEQEAANTITIVFDLDETLCNNRCPTGTILRPGAELLLRTLRGLCPSPRYKLIDFQTRSQRASSRLYDEAMYRMGVTPPYRSRVAQRQSANGYHNTGNAATAEAAATCGANTPRVAKGSPADDTCNTGEARPATARDKNPLRLELVLWTASEETLARRAMCHIDPMSKIFDEAIYRDPRWYRDTHYTKELSRLGRCMERVVIVENSIDSVTRNRRNAILVTSFVRNRLDRQLFLVREVLRDWVRSMKMKLAEQQYAARAASAQQESIEVTTALDVQPRTVKDAVDCRAAESEEEGGESPVPPHSTPTPTGDGRSERVPASADEAGTHTRRGNPVHDNPGDVSLRGAVPRVTVSVPYQPSTRALSVSSSPLPSAPRPLSAMACRAPNIAEFLKHHRLIFPESNFLRFQLTGEIMTHLQTTESTLIAAALSQPPAAVEPADTRVARYPSRGFPRAARATSALVSASPSPATPVATKAAAVANPEGPSPRTSHSRAAGRELPSGVLATMDGATAAATRQRAFNEVDAVRIPAPALALGPPLGVPAARATRDSGPSSSRYSDMTRGADVHRDPLRLQYAALAAPKRPVRNAS